MTGRRVAVVAKPVLAGAGLLIAVYLTVLHYDTQVPLFCSSSGTIDCARVLTSAQSVVLGLPVAAWGLAWFVVALVLLAGRTPAWTRAFSVWTVVGAISVVYLVYAELLVIGKICAWCTAIHIIVLALFVLQQTVPAPEPAA